MNYETNFYCNNPRIKLEKIKKVWLHRKRVEERRAQGLPSESESEDESRGSDSSLDSDQDVGLEDEEDPEVEEKAQEGKFTGDMYVFAAKGLPKVDWFGSIDSYIKVQWDDEDILPKKAVEKGKKLWVMKPIKEGCPVREQNRRPRYDMHYIIPFSNAPPDAQLVVQIWDKDKQGADDFISVSLGCE